MKTIIFAIVLLAGTFAQARPEWRYEQDDVSLGTYTETQVKGFGHPHSYLYQGQTRQVVMEDVEKLHVDFETGITNLVTVSQMVDASLCVWFVADLLPRKATPAELDEVATATATAEAQRIGKLAQTYGGDLFMLDMLMQKVGLTYPTEPATVQTHIRALIAGGSTDAIVIGLAVESQWERLAPAKADLVAIWDMMQVVE